MLSRGRVVGGDTTFYNGSWRTGISFAFFHEFAHMTDTVYKTDDPYMGSKRDGPGEVAADKVARDLLSKVYSGKPLCP